MHSNVKKLKSHSLKCFYFIYCIKLRLKSLCEYRTSLCKKKYAINIIMRVHIFFSAIFFVIRFFLCNKRFILWHLNFDFYLATKYDL